MNETILKIRILAHLARTAWKMVLWAAEKENRHENSVKRQEPLNDREKTELLHYRHEEVRHLRYLSFLRGKK